MTIADVNFSYLFRLVLVHFAPFLRGSYVFLMMNLVSLIGMVRKKKTPPHTAANV